MPTYDYRCSQCGHAFEVFHGMTASPEILCEKCQAPAVKMIGGGAGIHFKGTGFYVTDYKKKSGDSGSSSGNKTSAAS